MVMAMAAGRHNGTATTTMLMMMVENNGSNSSLAFGRGGPAADGEGGGGEMPMPLMEGQQHQLLMQMQMAAAAAMATAAADGGGSAAADEFAAAVVDMEDYDEQMVDPLEMQTRQTVKLVFCICYAILFLLGTLGNGLVIVMICNVLSTLSRSRSKCAGSSRKLLAQASAQHVFIYVLGLSIVDLFVILHLPLLIFEMREGQWMFGEFVCKVYWFGESVNKLLSSFLMTVLSWDRYMAVCFPIKSIKIRTNSIAIAVLAGCTFIATLLLYPVLNDSTVLRVNKLTGLRLLDDESSLMMDTNVQEVLLANEAVEAADGTFSARGGTEQQQQQQQIVLKCVFDTNSPFFMLYTFTAGYVVPALLITFFYAQVILKLRNDALSVRKHSDSQSSGILLSSARLHKVTKRIVAVILFYFFCWTPYWLLNILSQFSIIIVNWSTLTLSSVFFAAHLLVCFNSAANPVLYALINRELRQQHAQAFQKRRRSLHLVTNNALGFIDKRFPSLPSPSKLKEHRLASFGCSDDTQFRLLGGNPLLMHNRLRHSADNGELGRKSRSSSFSHFSPTLHQFAETAAASATATLTFRWSHLRLFQQLGVGNGAAAASRSNSQFLDIYPRRSVSHQEQQPPRWRTTTTTEQPKSAQCNGGGGEGRALYWPADEGVVVLAQPEDGLEMSAAEKDVQSPAAAAVAIPVKKQTAEQWTTGGGMDGMCEVGAGGGTGAGCMNADDAFL